MNGIRTFIIIWLGQAVSMIGTQMAQFGLIIWAYDQTGKATTLSLLGFFYFAAYVMAGPVGGVWVDRWDRKRVMIVADAAAIVVTVVYLGLFLADGLQIWMLYVGEVVAAVASAFQHPAYNASQSVLVPRQHLARANGLRALSYDTSNILGPALGGSLVALGGVPAVLIVDVLTFGVAMGTLAVVTIPQPKPSAEGQARGSFWRDLTVGVRYIGARPGLVGLTVVFMFIFFAAALTYFGVLPAMILARSGGDEMALAAVQSTLGVGGIVGGLIVTAWGGPRRQIHGVLAFCAASFAFGDLLFAVGRSTTVWVLGAFVAAFFIPFISSANRAIWQAKVPHDMQGRVLSAAFSLQQLTRPLGMLLAGPLADYVFEPTLQGGGVFQPLVGAGPGAGMGLMFLITAVAGTVFCLGGYLFPALRNVERDLPDAETLHLAPAPGD